MIYQLGYRQIVKLAFADDTSRFLVVLEKNASANKLNDYLE